MVQSSLNKKDALGTLVGGVLGFSLFWITSHHKSPVKRKLPLKNIKVFTICPI